MKILSPPEEQLEFWQKKLESYQKKYDELRKQSPDRWWHDEFFDNQMQVLESSIISTKQRITGLKTKIKEQTGKAYLSPSSQRAK